MSKIEKNASHLFNLLIILNMQQDHQEEGPTRDPRSFDLSDCLRMLRYQSKSRFHLFSYRSEVKARQDVKPDIRQPPFTDYRQPPLDYRQPPGGDYPPPPPLDYRQPPLLDYRQHSPDTRQYPLSDYRQPQVPDPREHCGLSTKPSQSTKNETEWGSEERTPF